MVGHHGLRQDQDFHLLVCPFHRHLELTLHLVDCSPEHVPLMGKVVVVVDATMLVSCNSLHTAGYRCSDSSI